MGIRCKKVSDYHYSSATDSIRGCTSISGQPDSWALLVSLPRQSAAHREAVFAGPSLLSPGPTRPSVQRFLCGCPKRFQGKSVKLAKIPLGIYGSYAGGCPSLFCLYFILNSSLWTFKGELTLLRIAGWRFWNRSILMWQLCHLETRCRRIMAAFSEFVDDFMRIFLVVRRFLVMLQRKIDIDHSWEWKVKASGYIVPESFTIASQSPVFWRLHSRFRFTRITNSPI